jgi:tRNA(fMet)-specific endonuclease VapC
MTFLYMLDTNIVSSFMRTPRGPVQRRALAAGAGAACVSIITAAELRFGATKVASERLRKHAEDAFDLFPVVPFEPPADAAYAEIRALLEHRGSPIGPMDLLIAAHALALDLTLVTANHREFARVPGLKIENWLN